MSIRRLATTRLTRLPVICWVGVIMTLTVASTAGAQMTAQAPAPPLLPRQIIFGNPDKAQPRISPDGAKLAYIAPVDGVLNVYVGPVDDPSAAKPVTEDKVRGIRSYSWAYDGRHILYSQDQGGDENWHVYATDVTTQKTRDLTPFDSIPGEDGEPLKDPSTGSVLRPAARIQEVSPEFPHEVLIAINNRNPQLHDVYRCDIRTGALTLVRENPESEAFAGFLTDEQFQVRFGYRVTSDGGSEIVRETDDGWKPYIEISAEDTANTTPEGFNKAGDTLYLQDSRERNTAALVAIDLKTDERKILAEDLRADAGETLRHPTTREIQAVSFDYDRMRWELLDEALKDDFTALERVDRGDVFPVSRTLDDSKWIVAYEKDNGPVAYYLYERPAKKASLLFTNRKALEGKQLAKMHPVIITARDGLKLVCYLSLPSWIDTSGEELKLEQSLPLVLNVHGGPWARDDWGYHSEHQWLANRGYAVLSVNYRGSTGLGKNFLNAGNKEWAGKMHDDLIDAVDWAVEKGIADPKRLAIYGGSYGGYAALVGLTFTPDKFTCGVDIVGPSNLVTLLNSIPPYWAPLIDLFTSRVGDHRTEAGRAFLESRSPLTRVNQIRKPLLIGQGANDPRVKQAESDQIVSAMQERDIPVTYVLFPDEGHGFARPQNRLAFYAVAEAFLAEHLGGRVEPIGDDFEGSSIEVPEGGSQVPGLAEAIGKSK